LFNAFDLDKPYFSAAALGIYSAATHLPWFTFLFDQATGSPDQDMLVRRAGMPRQGTKLDQAEFDIVAEWFARGLPQLEELVPLDPGEPCTPSITEPLKNYVREHLRSGWRAKNAQNSLLMYGCGQQRGAECLASATDTATLPHGKNWNAVPGGHVRLLFDNSGHLTHFWTRTSADGRYLASGSVAGEKDPDSAQIVDLHRNTRVGVAALYDPAFFPDNSGFVFMGAALQKGEEGEGILTCSQSVLSRSPERVSGSEPECRILASKSIGLYEGVGQPLAGGDYFAASGPFQSDDHGFPDALDASFRPPTNPFAPFDADSSVTVTPLINDGQTFVEGAATLVKVPQQGDPILSPSAGLLVLRVKGAEKKVTLDPEGKDPAVEYIAEQAGYALHLMKATKVGGKLQASLERAGSICVSGGKPSVSYDERWMILHQYISEDNAVELGFSGPDDPKFAAFKQQGGSNLVLVDLLSGAARRITNVSPGQYALYPSFRSDGWIYFVLRSGQDLKEYFLASDATLVLER
jgi:hypothetical protein